jgi:segregation and condensation protein B
MRLTQIIEALLFASDAPLSAMDLSRVDERLDEDTVEAVIRELRAEYELGERSFQIYEVAGGYQILTRPEFVSVLERYDSVPQPARLSAPALEVLAIIAYRQPIGRAEVEDIRGVGSSGVLRTLVERDLVAPVGRAEGLGRPLLYGTTKKFLDHFGFRSLEDLPRPDELPVVLRERPAPQPAEGGDDAPAGEPDAAAPAGTPAEPAGQPEPVASGDPADAEQTRDADAALDTDAVSDADVAPDEATPAAEAATPKPGDVAADSSGAPAEQAADDEDPAAGPADAGAEPAEDPALRGG